jgi:hypothetical protein
MSNEIPESPASGQRPEDSLSESPADLISNGKQITFGFGKDVFESWTDEAWNRLEVEFRNSFKA